MLLDPLSTLIDDPITLFDDRGTLVDDRGACAQNERVVWAWLLRLRMRCRKMPPSIGLNCQKTHLTLLYNDKDIFIVRREQLLRMHGGPRLEAVLAHALKTKASYGRGWIAWFLR